ncbi:hypothetical protein M408DRAFT_30366 [Serendipita vermifera MAFF 305830]|uniref:Uncharacterized protein n=1 Tax=Serendipita vermifera MAFF 305830 TaxID=933852 RepID=A0A0C3A720_SERVB|nr:hypothetical protein M408DRAFT_30366 [Serendipita vermifera MAFF 305830]
MAHASSQQSAVPPPNQQSHKSPPPKQPQYEPSYGDLTQMQVKVKNVLQSTGWGNGLALEMKNSEMAIRDLNAMVRISNLPSRDQLVPAIDRFGELSKQATRQLHRLGSHVGNTIDSMTAMDHYAIKVLEKIENEQPLVQAMAFAMRLAAQGVFRKTLMETFHQVAETMGLKLNQLIEESMALTKILDNLENQLGVIDSIIRTDNQTVCGEQYEVRSSLWTWLGGNRAELHNIEQRLMLLKMAGRYHHRAAKSAATATFQLEKLSEDLGVIRKEVGTLADPSEKRIPVEAHLEVLRSAVRTLGGGTNRERVEWS